ncbi:MAG TPA: right-handed parallel beta-helix repeat-containing protein [Bryobacteraceae bacterium]|jgi:parallel beta-helix repeat protein|nr:right-handed parallel beta-helix repeat-containing protein [Bryobacteraceae bacterium]
MFQRLNGHVPVRTGIAFCALALAVACQPMFSATLCVNPTGATGCQATIGAAVAAAKSGDVIQVAAGTYKEDVTISSTLSLIGAGSATTIIDATGLANGINIDGSAAAPMSGVSGVVVSGFTVENANFQGILVQNASWVTVSNNQVLNNNKALVPSEAGSSCPGLPAALAAGEAFDCGEGINLTGVDHSVVANNVVQHNSGGMLISDDTGATHDNVISGNLVSDNGYACGITMASHSGMSVYHNTVSGNQSLRNGLLLFGEGAGVGIYAAGPGMKNYSNQVINNVIMGNGLPGVAMHNHAAPPGAPAADLDDNVIVGNTISQNGADVEDTATSGTAGINIHSLVPVNGIVISENLISQESIGVAFTAPSGAITAMLNNFTAVTGIFNGGGGSINAPQNWWGCLGGPQSPACAVATGPVTFTPWLTGPFSSTVLPSAPTGGGSTPPATGVTIVITGPGGITSATNTFQVSSSVISLDASKSTSSNGGALSYSWTIAPGYTAIGIPGGNTATPTIQLPYSGTFQLILRVTDSTGATATATVTLQYS